MNNRKLLPQISSLALGIFLLMGCRSTDVSAPSATPSLVPIHATAVPTQAVDADQWQVISQIEVTHPTTIAGFLNDTFGITAGPDGETHYTTDGGKTWTKANNSSWCRFGLDIVDEQVAWHCGNPGHVRVTTDGAMNWQAVSDFGPSEPTHCRFLSFLDDKTGWTATPNQLAATHDSGMTWTEIARPNDIQTIMAIALRTALDGYILDSGGKLFVTQDGGGTWSTRMLAPKTNDSGKSFAWYVPSAAVRFLDSERGLVVTNFRNAVTGKDQVMAMRTADGGQTWSQESIPGTGALYLAHDGETLTITSLTGREITVFRYRKN